MFARDEHVGDCFLWVSFEHVSEFLSVFVFEFDVDGSACAVECFLECWYSFAFRMQRLHCV